MTYMKLSQKIKIYLASFFLTPLGLYWFFKYFRSEDPALKKEGNIALLLTLASLAISYIIISQYVKAYSGYLDLYKNSMDVYTQMGY